MSYLPYFCLLAYSGIQHILCCVFFVLLVLVLLPVSLDCFCFACPRLVYPMLPVSLDCPILLARSVFSNVYLLYNQ